MKRSELIRILDRLESFPHPDPAEEQVRTPAENAAELLGEAKARDDLAGRIVADLGAGTGTLAVGAALLGATRVIAVERDPGALRVAEENARTLGVEVEWREESVDRFREPVDTVVMNPPFGAQRRGADTSFWATAFTVASRAVYAFSLSQSRTFIERRAVASGARIESCRAVPWVLPHTFAHHRERRRRLPVDLWVLRKERDE